MNEFNKKTIRIVTLSKKAFEAISYKNKPDGIISLFLQKNLSVDKSNIKKNVDSE
tara:strand:- start:235 stop:399 length:165 start_codon:yes stop_codon:yes gene_type:complete